MLCKLGRRAALRPEPLQRAGSARGQQVVKCVLVVLYIEAKSVCGKRSPASASVVAVGIVIAVGGGVLGLLFNCLQRSLCILFVRRYTGQAFELWQAGNPLLDVAGR